MYQSTPQGLAYSASATVFSGCAAINFYPWSTGKRARFTGSLTRPSLQGREALRTRSR